MKTLFKSILLGLLIGNQAIAGLPPTTIQGQFDASPKTKFSFQVPFQSFTDLGGVKAYLDTGNRNLLVNSSFEHSSFLTGWTATTITPTLDTTNIVDGKQAASLPYTFQTGGITQTVTPTVQLAGVNLEATCRVKTISSSFEVCGLSGGVVQNCNLVPASGQWTQVTANFAGTANGATVGIKIDVTGSTSGTAVVDDCYLGVARNIGTGPFTTPWVSYTPTIAGFGTVSGVSFFYRRNESNLEVQGGWTTGTVPAGTIASLSIPPSLTIDATHIATAGNTTANAGTNIGNYSGYGGGGSGSLTTATGTDATKVYFGRGWQVIAGSNALTPVTGDFVAASNQYYGVWFSVPISQYTDQTFLSPNSTPANWSGYQDSISGGCSTSSATYADPSACTTIATTMSTSQNITCVQAAASADAITCTLPKGGNYKVKAKVNLSATAPLTASASLTDSSNVAIDKGTSQYIATAGKPASLSLSGDYPANGAGTFTFKVRLATDTSTVSITQGTATGSSAINWEILQEGATMGSPYLLGMSSGSSVITAGTTFTTPATITSNTRYKFVLVGGGAGGAGNAATSNNGSPGGGAGDTCTVQTSGLVPSTTYTIAIGSAGTGGAAGANPGNNGGNTTLTINGTTYTAGGGSGATAGVNTSGGAGGSGINCTFDVPGQAGGTSTASNVVAISGLGGSSLLGLGGPAVLNGNGMNGTGFGAGGAGGKSPNTAAAQAGGNGTQGVIIVEWSN